MELLQDCFNKYDDWITRVRTGLIVGLSALASIPILQRDRISICKLIAAGILFVLASYIAEGITRNENWFWYVKRKEEIEKCLNSKPTAETANNGVKGIKLYAVKFHEKCKINRYERIGRCWAKCDTLLFHIGSIVLFVAVTLLLR